MEEGPDKVQSQELWSDTLKLMKSQSHLHRSKCWLLWTLRILWKNWKN